MTVAPYPEFFNDVFGPVMQPGSSSHTAGPCRLGYLAGCLLGEPVARMRDRARQGGLVRRDLRDHGRGPGDGRRGPRLPAGRRPALPQLRARRGGRRPRRVRLHRDRREQAPQRHQVRPDRRERPHDRPGRRLHRRRDGRDGDGRRLPVQDARRRLRAAGAGSAGGPERREARAAQGRAPRRDRRADDPRRRPRGPARFRAARRARPRDAARRARRRRARCSGWRCCGRCCRSSASRTASPSSSTP